MDFDVMTDYPGEAATGLSMYDSTNEPPAKHEVKAQEAA